MKIIETTIFTKKVNALLTDDEYRNLQNTLILNPGKGKIIRGSGGLRKIRWNISGRGKVVAQGLFITGSFRRK